MEKIKREENTIYIATISGGKDSQTQADLLLKNGYPVDEIIFCDTLLEFDEMYDYIEKIKKYFKKRYKKEITVLKPKSTFEKWCYGTIAKGERKGQIRGIPTADGMCYWRREAKVRPLERYVDKKYSSKSISANMFLHTNSRSRKLIKDRNKVIYLGYTLGEQRSVNAEIKNTRYEYPLQDIFKMKESDCLQYLEKQEMQNILYNFFTRLGCFLCPFQSKKSWYEIWLNFPKLWEYCKNIEKELEKLEKQGHKIVNRFWFTKHRTCADMEKEFKLTTGSMFDFSDEPLKDCFCKI